MNEMYDVAAAKSRFSELLNRAAYGHERFLIRKRGKPVAAIVSTDDLAWLEGESRNGTQPPRGLIAAAGLVGDIPEGEAVTQKAYEARQTSAEDQARLDDGSAKRHGLLAAVGILADFEDWEDSIESVIAMRSESPDREVSLD